MTAKKITKYNFTIDQISVQANEKCPKCDHELYKVQHSYYMSNPPKQNFYCNECAYMDIRRVENYDEYVKQHCDCAFCKQELENQKW